MNARQTGDIAGQLACALIDTLDALELVSPRLLEDLQARHAPRKLVREVADALEATADRARYALAAHRWAEAPRRAGGAL